MQRPLLKGFAIYSTYNMETRTYTRNATPLPVYILDYLGYGEDATAIVANRQTGKIYEVTLDDVTLDTRQVGIDDYREVPNY